MNRRKTIKQLSISLLVVLKPMIEVLSSKSTAKEVY